MYARKKNGLKLLPARPWYLFIPLIVVATLYTCTTIAIYSYTAHSETILKLYNTIVFLPIVLSHIIFAFLSPSMASTPNEQKLIRSLKIIVSFIGLAEIALLLADNNTYNSYVNNALNLLLGAIPVLIVRYKCVGIVSAKSSYEALFTAEKEIATRKLQLDNTRHIEILSLLETTLTTKKLYKDEDLTLERLSAAAGINRHHISKTLNVFAQKSFYQYINEYRVQEVIKLLDAPAPRAISLLAVAFECGFKTKASFNQHFKKAVGITPSAYLKNKKAAKAA
ncbi:helix-turn-helix transcriptional regulator [Flavobacterium zepuense]|uniref:Helix-turn-helix transcriptional regulator n=1 Tax=Flavobacterium zepuense TaxID=2593302 RepID=A0A552UV27_9FLAO|nr:helix-turn-helix transcriptional regulator [Flavobacterium zepuense]TRW22049.1 helix-turn-helix transcriptional regulator [Flavobacterium zepuense]